MSMLAERKRKTKWVVNPTKKPLWTQDSSGIKFGKELMEKMGWSAGKGLGLKEQGIEEPLRVSYKNDTKGMGFKGHDEDWIEHQDEFNMLLSQLSNNNDTAVVEESETEKPKIKSLELKSKHSRARVHYQKFTRGKDLTNYSEKDLACILGLNKAKEEKSKPEEVMKTESKNEYETSFGVTTINSGSIEDYFKKKYSLDKLKSNNLFRNVEVTENPSEDVTDGQSIFPGNEESREPFGEEKKHKKRKNKWEAGSVNCEIVEGKSEEPKCKKRKTSKSKEETEMLEDNIACGTTENGSEEQKSKKRKASKTKGEPSEMEKSEEDNFTYQSVEKGSEEQKSKERKAEKLREFSRTDETEKLEADNLPFETVEKANKEKKCKKKKTSDPKEGTPKTEKSQNGEKDDVAHETTGNRREEQKYKKKKTSKSKEVSKSDEAEKCEADDMTQETTEKESEEPKSKRKKIPRPKEVLNTKKLEADYETTESEEHKPKKKKKTPKSNEETEKSEKDSVTCEVAENVSEEQNAKKKKASKSNKEPSKTDEIGKYEIDEIEISEGKNYKDKTEANPEETKIKKKRKNRDKNDGTSENNRQAMDHSPDDESFAAVLKEQNKKAKRQEKKSKQEKHKSLLETEKVPVEDEESIFLKEKKSKKRKHKSDLEIEVDNVDNSNAPVEKDEQEKRKLVEILEKKYKIKRKGQESVETKNDPSVGDVSENDSRAVIAGAEGTREVVNGQEPANEPKKFTSEKVLDLVRWADIKEFRGSNLKTVLGYGFKKEILRNKLG